MARDAKLMRGERPFVFANLERGDGVLEIIKFIQREGMLASLPADFSVVTSEA